MRADGSPDIALRFDSAREAALSLYDRGEYVEAEGFLTEALQADPSDVDVVWRTSSVELWKGNVTGARETALYALGLDARCHQACAVLCSCSIAFGEYALAEQFADRCLELSPNAPGVMWSKANCELYRGDYKNGFERWKYGRSSKVRWQRFPDKEWDGSKVGTLFVWCEQGHGDVFQFSRFLPMLKGRAENVVCEVYNTQLLLYKGQGWDVQFIAQPKDGSCAYDFDAHVSVLDLPRYLGIESPGDVGSLPYLKPNDKMVLDSGSGRKTGIVWKGAATHMNDPQRSLTDEMVAPLLAFPLVSLQTKAECPEQWADAGSVLKDYTQTAAVLATLDLLVTVDTSVAHLAGAMGVPTWLIAPSNGEWRWGHEGDTSPWYGSFKVFRSKESLSEAVEEIAAGLKNGSTELRDLAHGDRGVRPAHGSEHHPDAGELVSDSGRVPPGSGPNYRENHPEAVLTRISG